MVQINLFHSHCLALVNLAFPLMLESCHRAQQPLLTAWARLSPCLPSAHLAAKAPSNALDSMDCESTSATWK